MATTYERVSKIVAEQFGVGESEIDPADSFVDDLSADSLDLPELIMSLEEEFGVKLSDEEAEKIRTVGDAVEYLDAHSHHRSLADPRADAMSRPLRSRAG